MSGLSKAPGQAQCLKFSEAPLCHGMGLEMDPFCGFTRASLQIPGVTAGMSLLGRVISNLFPGDPSRGPRHLFRWPTCTCLVHVSPLHPALEICQPPSLVLLTCGPEGQARGR